MSKVFVELTEVIRQLNSRGMSVEEISLKSGLSEKDVKAVLKKGTQLIRARREDAMKKLRPLYDKLIVSDKVKIAV